MFLFPRARIKTVLLLLVFVRVVSIPAVALLGYWILIQVLRGIIEFGSLTQGGIAWFAHVGGLVTGVILIIMMRKPRSRPYLRKR